MPIGASGRYGIIETVYNAVTLNGTAVLTSPWYTADDSEYFGIGWSATSVSGTSDVKTQYQQAFINNEASKLAAVTVVASDVGEIWRGQSIAPIVAPFIRFIITGNAPNPSDTVLTFCFFRQ